MRSLGYIVVATSGGGEDGEARRDVVGRGAQEGPQAGATGHGVGRRPAGACEERGTPPARDRMAPRSAPRAPARQ